MSRVKDALNVILHGKPVSTEEVVLPPLLNRYPEYPANGLNPRRLAEIFRDADQGSMLSQAELFEEMLERDPHLQGLYSRRKLSVLKRDYQVIPFSSDERDKQIAEYCANVIKRVDNWRYVLEDILDAVWKGVSISQIFWKVDSSKKVWIDKIEYAHLKNFRFGLASDPLSDMRAIRRITDTNRADGVPLESDRWLVAIIKARSGHPARTSLMRTLTWLWLFKNFDVKSWIQFAEMYFHPIRIGKYGTNTGKDEKAVITRALRQLAQDAWALVPDTSKIEFVEIANKAATAAVHSDLAAFCNAEMSKAALGHSSALDATPGRLGAENSAEDATYDIVAADSLAIDYIITDQLFKRICLWMFNESERIPRYNTIVKPPKDIKERLIVISGALNQIGIPLATNDVYDELSLRVPGDGDEIIAPHLQPQNSPQEPESFSTPLRSVFALADESKKKV